MNASSIKQSRAAQYLRVSDEQHAYSIENQRAFIARFAEGNGYKIVRSYEDAGKSGLTLKGRPALQRLLAEVVGPDRPFETLLVYDVSRWGRFQNIDEAAHYEFLCRAAGLKILYCAEPFVNESGAFADIAKNLKRAMAAEFSRDLSSRLCAAQRRNVQRGFMHGGRPSYGFRRRLRDAAGTPVRELQSGEHKTQDGKVVLGHGPTAEQDTIRQIFKLFVHEGLGLEEIARVLNAQGAPKSGRSWEFGAVRRILCNELVTGVMVYGRNSERLGGRRTARPESEWIRVRVLDPIISPALFARARRRFEKEPHCVYSRERMIRVLKQIHRRHSHVSKALIIATPGAPSPDLYAHRFGTLRQAYEAAGLAVAGRQVRGT